MKIYTSTNALKKVAKITGLLFLLNLLVPLLNWTLVLSKLIVTENAIDTVQNILDNKFLFRINIINELLISVIVTALAVALYILLKSVNRNLALLALFLKLTESMLWAVIALGHAAVLPILTEQNTLKGVAPEQIQALVGHFLNAHMSITAIPGIFLGMNLVLFLYLLFKSNLVPKILAGFGVFSYGLIFMYDLSMVIVPMYSEIMIVQIFGWGPSIFFEIMIGLWLLIKGVNAKNEILKEQKVGE
jgi:hypothetical protein